MFENAISLLTEECIEFKNQMEALECTDQAASFSQIIYLKDIIHEYKQAIDVLKNFK